MRSKLCTPYFAVMFALTSAFAVFGVGCRAHEEAVDPDGKSLPTAEDRAADEAKLRGVSLASVVGAVAGVPTRDAPEVLARWLRDAGDATSPLLARWPRRADGALDLQRPPVVASSIDGELSPLRAGGGKSSCGDLAVVFRGDDVPSMRLHLTVPATSKACRGAMRDEWIHGAEALPALDDAVRAASVPDVEPTSIAATR